MALRYDFDIVRHDDGAVTAHFRDPRTVAAISGADDVVRDYFEASGFRETLHDSGAGHDFYPARHESCRIDVIERLGDNLWNYDVAEADLNGFCFDSFMSHLGKARPVDMLHDAFDIGLPVQRMFQSLRRRIPQTRMV